MVYDLVLEFIEWKFPSNLKYITGPQQYFRKNGSNLTKEVGCCMTYSATYSLYSKENYTNPIYYYVGT